MCERAKPAPGVTDVGEVDVAVDDVGDSVADRVASKAVGKAGQRLDLGAGQRLEQHQSISVTEACRVGFGMAQRRRELTSESRDRNRLGDGAAAVSRLAAHPHRLPGAVRRVDVGSLQLAASLGVDRLEQIDPPGVVPAAIRLLPRQTDGQNVWTSQPAVVAQRLDV